MDKRDWVARLSQLGCLKREVDELSQRIARLETEAMGGEAHHRHARGAADDRSDGGVRGAAGRGARADGAAAAGLHGGAGAAVRVHRRR